MSKSNAQRPRLGRGLNSLMSLTGPEADEGIEGDESAADPVFREIPPMPATPQAQPPLAEAAGSAVTDNIADPGVGQHVIAVDANAAANPAGPTPASAPASVLSPAPVELPSSPYRMLRLPDIRPNPMQPRRQMDADRLAELAASLKANGVIQPIVVRQRPEGGWELIAGERRFRAARQAGLDEIPAIVREVDRHTQAQLALVENIQREDLNPIDRAVAYQTLVSDLGLTQNELALRLGEDRSSIANFLRLLELTPTVQDYLRNRELTLGHAKVLAGVTDPVMQSRTADLCVTQGLSVRNLERVVKSDPPPAPVAKPVEEPSAHVRSLETDIARQLGLRVQVRSGAKKGRGKVIIHYATLDQFDQLMRRMSVHVEDE